MNEDKYVCKNCEHEFEEWSVDEYGWCFACAFHLLDGVLDNDDADG